jgi:hypothetical protein
MKRREFNTLISQNTPQVIEDKRTASAGGGEGRDSNPDTVARVPHLRRLKPLSHLSRDELI